MQDYFYTSRMIFGCYPCSGLKQSDPNHFDRLSLLIVKEKLTLTKFEAASLKLGFVQYGSSFEKVEKSRYFADSSGNQLFFTGSIYNKKELAETLNFDSNSISDVELIHRAIYSWGPDFVKRLNGEFSIVLYLQSENTLYLFRDHLGTIPLAYTTFHDIIYFSNDILSLCKAFHKNDEIIQVEPMLKYFRMVDYTQAYNRNIKKLLPGHYLEYNNGNIKIVKYWHPEKIRTDRSLTREKMLTEIKTLLNRSVADRCACNRKTASHMSGGLDSGIVAALAKKTCKNQTDFIGYSWSPPGEWTSEKGFDERNMVKDQAELNKIEARFINAGAEEYNDLNNQRINNFGFFDEDLVLADAEKSGIRIMLTGHGGDEFVSKGDRGIDTDLLLNLNWKLFIKRNPLRKPKRFLHRFLYEIVLPVAGILPYPIRKDAKLDTQYLLPRYKNSKKELIKNFFFYSSRRKLQLGFLYCYYLPERMDVWYTNGIRHGIEYRYPLLDKDIVEYILKIPSQLLVNKQWSRTIIREVSEGLLPESVRWRNSGLDPVSFQSARKNVYACSKSYFSEIVSFRNNPDLHFINFDKIESDIRTYNQEQDDEKYAYLLYNVFHIKGLHEFTKAYRQMPTLDFARDDNDA